MANNRVWLVCVCGERVLLAKHFLKGWNPWYQSSCSLFVEEHTKCFPHREVKRWGSHIKAMDPGWDHQFRLEYEG